MSEPSVKNVTRPRVLVLAHTYPNAALPGHGLWVARLTHAALPIAEPIVVSMIPWAPPGLPIPEWQRLRRVPAHDYSNGVVAHFPRVPGGLLHFTHSLDARLALPAVLKLVRQLHAERPFHLIHAHFIYPEGVIATKIGRELGIPVVITEHANWTPWLDNERRTRTQVIDALPSIGVVTAVSEATRRTVREVAGDSMRVELLPNVLDEGAFVAAGLEPRIAGRILFVGIVRRVKGQDVLIRALALLLESQPGVHLRVIGSTLTRSGRRDELAVRSLAATLGVADRIEFIGHLDPRDLSLEMRRAAVLAVPSRRESFSAVTMEALASGTPVVATRCGGPEELIDDSVGRLVPVDDPTAMAAALGEVLLSPERFDPALLRAHVLPRFGISATTERLARLYESVLPKQGCRIG